MTGEQLRDLIAKCDLDLAGLHRDRLRYKEHGNEAEVAKVDANIKAMLKTRAEYCESLTKLG